MSGFALEWDDDGVGGNDLNIDGGTVDLSAMVVDSGELPAGPLGGVILVGSGFNGRLAFRCQQ